VLHIFSKRELFLSGQCAHLKSELLEHCELYLPVSECFLSDVVNYSTFINSEERWTTTVSGGDPFRSREVKDRSPYSSEMWQHTVIVVSFSGTKTMPNHF
jgi:hypothetical protein